LSDEVERATERLNAAGREGKLKPHIDRVLLLERAAEAMALHRGPVGYRSRGLIGAVTQSRDGSQAAY
jgi:hypothetical protein